MFQSLRTTMLVMTFARLQAFGQEANMMLWGSSTGRKKLARSMVISSYDLGSSSSVRGGARDGAPRDQSSASVQRKDDDDSSLLTLDPLVVCGPSGVGKGTIIQRFMDELQQQHDKQPPSLEFGFTVSHTTRSPRPGEVNGVHYHFTSKTDFENRRDEGGFMEWAAVHDNFYGTSWQSLFDVQALGRKCLLDIDVQGVQKLKELQSSQHQQDSREPSNSNRNRRLPFRLAPKYIFIAPPDVATLQTRLLNRATESPESLQLRLRNAAAEVEYGTSEGNFDAVVVNDDLDQAVETFRCTVLKLYNTDN